MNDSELAYLEFIQLFVEVLDHYFGEVKELDLIFNFNMVYAILDEMIVGGEIMETSKQRILSTRFCYSATIVEMEKKSFK